MTHRVAVLCWEESRPWVSALRQQGYSVPWVDEPKADVQKQVDGSEPDLLLVDLTRLPDSGASTVGGLADSGSLAGIPVVFVTADGAVPDSIAALDVELSVCEPEGLIEAVQAALTQKQKA